VLVLIFPVDSFQPMLLELREDSSLALLPWGVGCDGGTGFHLGFITEDFREGLLVDRLTALCHCMFFSMGWGGYWAVCMLILRGLCILPTFPRVVLCYLGASHLRVQHKESWFPGMHIDAHSQDAAGSEPLRSSPLSSEGR